MNRTVEEILTQFKGKEKNLHYYLSGFVDGEGSFSVAIIKTKMHKLGWMINPCFQVYQHEKHREILELCRYIFQTGSIYRKSGVHPVLNFSIDSRRGLIEKVIPFFDKYPLVVKQDTYQTFRAIVMALERQEHISIDGFKKIVDLAYTMNQQGKGRKNTKEFILSTLPTNNAQESSETIRRIPPRQRE
ncbi:MAG: LAGLIDADG family homing endonuclease [Candidatus Vogelbacteria bacterium]|nr:LAGLIDADG family homing endonuclease [Candidatus Vogelbacteria bacterium]